MPGWLSQLSVGGIQSHHPHTSGLLQIAVRTALCTIGSKPLIHARGALSDTALEIFRRLIDAPSAQVQQFVTVSPDHGHIQ
jgi:hypothetical protein